MTQDNKRGAKMVLNKIKRGIDLANIIKNWPGLFISTLDKKRKLFELKLRNGLKFRIRTGYSSDHNIFREVFIEKIYTPDSLPLGDGTVIDVGAHIGFFSIMASQKAKEVIAVEPTDSNGKLLEENILLNNKKNITVVRKALGKGKEKRKMYINKTAYHTGLHSFYKSIASQEFEKDLEEIETTSIGIDQLFKDYNIKSCEFLKMDCEGAEYDILLNASDKTLGKIKKIAISTHDVEKYNGQILADFLVKKGFKVWFAPGGHPLYAKNKNI